MCKVLAFFSILYYVFLYVGLLSSPQECLLAYTDVNDALICVYEFSWGGEGTEKRGRGNVYALSCVSVLWDFRVIFRKLLLWSVLNSLTSDCFCSLEIRPISREYLEIFFSWLLYYFHSILCIPVCVRFLMCVVSDLLLCMVWMCSEKSALGSDGFKTESLPTALLSYHQPRSQFSYSVTK
jgi:hypothetical protein